MFNSISSSITMYNLRIIMFACFGSITYGYCSAIISTTLGQPSFRDYFNLDRISNTHQIEGGINGLFQAGGLLGALAGGYVADRFGRLTAIFTSCVFCVVGGALQAGSAHIAMFMAARFVTGLGVGAIVLLTPLWQSEVAPPHARGLLVGLHGVSILIGYSTATWLGFAFFYVDASNTQWRVPLAIQVIPPLALASIIKAIPESPRWLVKNSNEETARHILNKIHKGADADGTLADDEFNQIKTQLAFERTLPSSWKSIFAVAHYRRRALIGFFTLFSAQLTGTMIIINYGPSLYALLGYGQAETLMITAGWITLGFPCNIINANLLDVIGRRWLLVIGLAGCCIALLGEIVMLALFSGTNNTGGNIAAVFFLFLHQTFYACCIDASTYVYACEIWPTHLRAKGFSLSIGGLFCGSLIMLMAAPTAFANIQWRFYLVTLCCSIISTVVIALTFPETKGLSLEEVAAKFGDDVAITLVGESVVHRTQLNGDLQNKETMVA
ncbi:sugar transporter family protein [Ilyonectria destructans]|nr:sugar transporter family protein [Ilyonectria destructans]